MINMQTILIFEEVPEASTVYLVDDAPSWLPLVDGLYLNSDVTDKQEAMLLRVSDALCKNPAHYNDSDDPLAGKWAACELPSATIIEGPVQVVRCGFLL